LKKLIILAICLSVIIALLALIMFGLNPAASRPLSLSGDQQKLVDSLGYPDIFTLMEMERFRFEIWTYFDKQRSFSFLNGRFQEDSFQDKISPSYGWPGLRPTQFKIGMTEDEVKRILNKPTAVGRIEQGELKGIVIYDYFDQVKVAFRNGMLIYMRTLPIPVD